jgi:hypothetical protein
MFTLHERNGCGMKAVLSTCLAVCWAPLALTAGLVFTSTHQAWTWVPFEQDDPDDRSGHAVASWTDQPFTVRDAA